MPSNVVRLQCSISEGRCSSIATRQSGILALFMTLCGIGATSAFHAFYWRCYNQHLLPTRVARKYSNFLCIMVMAPRNSSPNITFHTISQLSCKVFATMHWYTGGSAKLVGQ
ncbi:hypothetical protein V8C42DRAFT_311977 [Trichoderma barbatum]